MTTPVLFRKTIDNKVIAVMPTLPGPKNSIDSVCVGFTDSGECFVDTSLLRHTKPASYAEYVKLLGAMAEAGYTDIKIVHRVKEAFVEQRVNAKKGLVYKAPQERPLIIQAA